MTASFSSTSLVQNSLFAGDTDDLIGYGVVLAQGQNLPRGALLGRTAVSGTVSAIAASGNTGNGTITGLDIGGSAVTGEWVLVAHSATVFFLYNPEGIYSGKATVGNAFAGAVHFTISAGSNAFAIGDSFVLRAADVEYRYKLSLASATDGSQIPDAILAEDTSALTADQPTVVYLMGEFNANAIVFGAGHTLESTRDVLRAKDIHLITAIV